VQDAVGTVHDRVTESLGDAVDGASDAAGKATDAAVDTAKDATTAVADAASHATEAAVDTAKDAATAVANAASHATEAAVDTAKDVAAGVADATEVAVDTAKDAAAAVADAASHATEAAVDTAKDAAAAVADAASHATEAAVDTAKDAAAAVADAASGATEAAVDTAKDAAAAVADATEAAVDNAKDAAAAVADAASGAAESAVDTAKDAVAAVTGTAADAAGEAAAGEAAAGEATADAAAAAGAGAAAAAGAAAVANKPSKPRRRGKPKETTPEEAAVIAKLRDAQRDQTSVQGKVIGWNKGGYHVAVEGVAAFCPVSQIEIGNPRSPKRYVDREFPFRVLEVTGDGRRIVLSRAEALKAARTERAEHVKATYKPGQMVEGAISSLTDFGAFVQIEPGIEGLVHVSEISRQRVEHPKDVLKIGQHVKAQILKIEKGGQRISLSMRRLEKDPWSDIESRYTVGMTFEGEIKRRTEFGLFVEVEPGIEGLIHTSRLPIGKSLEDYEPGTTINGWVQSAEGKRRRLALSLREISSDDPWLTIHERFEVGKVVEGKVERTARFGAFIELEPGITGLLPFSEVQLSPGANVKRQFHPGKTVRIQVMSIEPNQKRISLGSEGSKAEGTRADYKEYMKAQRTEAAGGGMSALAAAFAKLKKDD
ncbi:MAG: S1 RNA-binding domain-containing protein, partial [Acidobacteriota bacterium]